MISHVHFLCGDETVGRERAKLRLINSVKELHGNITTESFDMETDDFFAFMESVSYSFTFSGHTCVSDSSCSATR